jgi:hypothetical protein
MRSRRWFAAAVVLALMISGAGAFAATHIVGGGVLNGPSARPENDAALRTLFPPYRIGHATVLGEYKGRTLFGARTALDGYCFSATSPTDPKGEGGHCVSTAEAATLDTGGGPPVAFAMSGSSVGGYAPRATSVRVAGAGIDVTFQVGENGWWLGAAELPKNPVPHGQDSALVIATTIGSDGRVLGHDPLMAVKVARNGAGRVISIGIASI